MIVALDLADDPDEVRPCLAELMGRLLVAAGRPLVLVAFRGRV